MAKMIGGYYVTAIDALKRPVLCAGPFKTAKEADDIGAKVVDYLANGAHDKTYNVSALEWGIGFFAFRMAVPGLLNGPLKVWVTGGEVEL